MSISREYNHAYYRANRVTLLTKQRERDHRRKNERAAYERLRRALKREQILAVQSAYRSRNRVTLKVALEART